MAQLERVVVTGAGGFIGAAVCRRLVDEGCGVLGLDVAPEAAPRIEAAGASTRVCDVTDPAALHAALKGADAVVHTAALLTEYGHMPDFVRVNVGGTRNVLDAARAHGIDPVVHLSSIATWGHEARHDLHDGSAPRTIGVPYVDTKAASDHLARRAGAVVVRPGDVYGPGSVPWAIRPLEALKAGRFVLPGSGEGLVTPVYVDDLVDCVHRALQHPEAAGQAFTAWDGHAVTAREFFDHYARMLGRTRTPTLPRGLLKAAATAEHLLWQATGRKPTVGPWAIDYFSRTASYSNTRAREVLGWEPRVDLAEGMRRTEAWFRAEGMLGAAV